MDITPQNNTIQPISDDQELSKALAGVLTDDTPAEPAIATGMQFEEIPGPTIPNTFGVAPTATQAVDPAVQLGQIDNAFDALPSLPEQPAQPEAQAAITATQTETPENTALSASPELEAIKSKALEELRPLIDHVDLPAEEKFDTYLMLIRSTDDESLIPAAHATAQAIEDEKRRAEALLDIIKEIDYLSSKGQSAN